MAYSNGFNIDDILPVLKGRVGFRSSDALRKYESFHAMCTEQNLRDVQPDPDITDVDFATYLDTLEDDIIIRCVSGVFSKPEQIETVLLHNRLPGYQDQSIANDDRFLGIKLTIVPDRNFSVKLRTVSVLVDGAVTGLKVYLYKEGSTVPITNKTVNTVANRPVSVTFDSILNAMESTTYYVGYFQSDLGSVKAIQETVKPAHTKLFSGVSFSAEKTATEVFDMVQISRHTNVGVNCDVQVFRDYTEIIKASPYLFDELIGLSMVYYVIEQTISSTRSNVTERILKSELDKMQLVNYLYGSVPISGATQSLGLKGLIAKKFDEVRKSFFPQTKITVASC